MSRTIRVTANLNCLVPTAQLVLGRNIGKCLLLNHPIDCLSYHHNILRFIRVSSSYTSMRTPGWQRQSGTLHKFFRTSYLLQAIDSGSSQQRLILYSQFQHRFDENRQRLVFEERDGRYFSLSAKDVVAASPSSLRPYLRMMRIDRPIGTWLVFLPCAWSISMAAPAGHLPDVHLLTLCALGAFFMRGAGCTINDMWDKNFDAQVARTMDRPLASGQISRFKALVFLAMPLSASLAILLNLNNNTILLGICSVLPCIVYPLMKRVTYWPQIFLGLTFNWGALMGWSAVHGDLHTALLPLYASCVAWTLVYDTIYAFQDKDDDLKIGLKSTALRFGDSSKYWLSGFTGAITAGLTTTGYLCDMTWPYYLGVAFFTGHLGHQIYSVDLTNSEDCGNKFRSNRQLGIIFWAAIVAATLLKKVDKQKEECEQ